METVSSESGFAQPVMEFTNEYLLDLDDISAKLKTIYDPRIVFLD